MKIIDNKKDYYDYLMGINGIDEKIVYDRRNSTKYDYFKKSGYPGDILVKATEVHLKVGDYLYIFQYNSKDKKWEFPSEINIGTWYNKTMVKNPCIYEKTKHIYSDEWKKYSDCPVVIGIYYYNMFNRYDKYVIPNPIISTFGDFKKFISPDEMWDNIYNFISHKYDKDIIDTRTDVQHLESAGFDKKTSFRNVK